MDKIRIGNDIHIVWSIFRDNQPEVFEGKDVEVRLIHTRTRDVIPLEWVISDGVVSATFYGKDQIDTGDYKLMLVENNGAPNMATIDECKAFTLVQCSCQEQKEEPSTSLQLYKVQLVSSFALSGGGNISVEGYPNVDELEEVKELSGNENIIVTDSEGNKKTTIGNLKEYVVKDISELPPFRIFENESDYNAVKDELGDCVVCLRDTGVMLYHVYSKAEDGEEGGGEIEDKYIRFADPEVQRICAENWGDGVGITKAQVEAVTDIGTVFKGNTAIESFDEFGKFVNAQAIPESAFSGCLALNSIDLSKVISLSHASFYNSGLTEIISLGEITSIPYSNNYHEIGCFTNSIKLTKVVLPDTLKNIGNYAFKNCPITEINLPQSLEIINSQALYGVKAPMVVDLPNLTTLGQASFLTSSVVKVLNLGTITKLQGNNDYNSFGDFYNCKNLEIVITPNTISSIAAYSLRGCSVLNTFVCKATTPPTLGSGSFTGTPIASGAGSIYVPDASVEAYKTATNWSSYASRIKGISELPSDNAELYNEIKDYLS